ncbi:unnamed protein product, partial [Polarella glacialis]
EWTVVVEHRKGRERQRRVTEEQSSKLWSEECNREQAEQWIQRKHKRQELLATLTSEWKAAAEEKRRETESNRIAERQAEREVVAAVAEGMVPPRRLRKPCEGFFSRAEANVDTKRAMRCFTPTSAR